MKRILSGGFIFVAGVIVAYWLLSGPMLERLPDSDASSRLPAVEQLDRSKKQSAQLGRGAEVQSATKSAATAIGSSDVPEIQQGTAPTDLEVADHSGVANSSPVPVLPGIELRGHMEVLHEQLEQEARDESWAHSMESELYNYFLANGQDLASNFGVPNVVCRSTLCEVQVVGYGEGSHEIWQSVTSDLESQPWATEIIEVRLGGNPIGPDSEGLILVIRKALADSTTQDIVEAVATI